MSRPALPRASSAMSGFFFCGSIDEPVAYASASRTNPNSSVDHSTISSPIRERCTCVSASDEQRLGDEVAIGDRVERVLERARELELGRDRRRDRAAGSTPRARPHRAARRRRAPGSRASGRRRARTSRSARADGARAAPVARAGGACSPGARSRSTPPRAASSVCWSSWMRRDLVAALAPEVQPQVERDLVVAAAAGVQLGAGRARDLGDPALDRGVDVLVGRCERERAARQLLLDSIERGDHDAALLVVSSPTRSSMFDVRAATRRGRRTRAGGRTGG